MKTSLFVLLLCVFSCNTSPKNPAILKDITAHPALERLMQGNNRYVNDRLEHPNRDQERRESLVASQAPFAIIVGCSDSRVSPEIVFDQGVGDLFVVRVAGNVIGPLELDSIDYAALYLKSQIIVVMGHESCGAVDAVIHGQTERIEEVARIIEPSVIMAKKQDPEHLLDACIKMNATRMKEYLEKSPALESLVREGKIEIYAAYYHLQDGVVEILP